jgi:plasmid stabilization system protein ParE
MAKLKVRLSIRAERWFLAYIGEIAEQNPAAARNILLRLEKLRETLADFPEMTERGQIPGTRRVVMRPLTLRVCEATSWKLRPFAMKGKSPQSREEYG